MSQLQLHLMFLSFFSVYDGPYWWHYYAALSPFLISLVQWDRGDHWCGEIVGERFSNFIMFTSSLIMPLVFPHATVWYAQGASLVITN